MNFLGDNSYFSKNQFGLLKGKSTTDAQLFVSKYIHKNLDKIERVLGIFLEIKKASDCVNLNILLKKLNSAGIRGNANNLIRSYLCERNQFIKIKNKMSHSLIVNHEVPQRTVLRPILFILFINGLLNIIIEAEIICFADDSVILLHDKNIEN